MTSRGAPSAGATCPACGVGTPAEARFCPACGQWPGATDGDRELARRAAAACRQAARRLRDRALDDLGRASGSASAADGHFAEGNRLSREIGYTRKRLWSLLGLVQVAIARGEPATARRLATEATELTTQPDGTADVEAELHLAELAPALRRAGRAEEADAAAKRVLSDASAMGALALVGRLAQHEGDGR